MRNEITEQFYPEKISLKEFFEILCDEQSIEMFKENMKKLKVEEEFPEVWAKMFVAWLEMDN